MTELPRLTLSLAPDIEAELNRIKSRPENEHTPKSRIICGLIRDGLEARRNDTVEMKNERPAM